MSTTVLLHVPSIVARPIAASLLAVALAACGGGGGSSAGSSAPTSPPAATDAIQLTAAVTQTIAAGQSITLNGSATSGSTPTWTLAAGSVGTLSASAGASVNYVPPASVAGNTVVTVTATVGSVSKSVVLTVFPDPGAPGLYVVSGRLNADILDAEVDGPVADARFRDSRFVASDLSGNWYVAETCQTPSHFSGISLRKIAGGIVSSLALCGAHTWFGDPNGANQLSGYPPQGLAVDSAGNIFLAAYLSTGSGARGYIQKVTPQGAVTVLAGNPTSTSATLQDGQGGAALFLTPNLVGIDSGDNLYVLDNQSTVVRKVTSTGAVSTIAALPTSLNADLNGNTYRLDATGTMIIQTTPAGVDSTIATTSTLPGTMSGYAPKAYSLTRTGPATYALIVANGYTFSNEVIAKLVVPH